MTGAEALAVGVKTTKLITEGVVSGIGVAAGAVGPLALAADVGLLVYHLVDPPVLQQAVGEEGIELLKSAVRNAYATYDLSYVFGGSGDIEYLGWDENGFQVAICGIEGVIDYSGRFSAKERSSVYRLVVSKARALPNGDLSAIDPDSLEQVRIQPNEADWEEVFKGLDEEGSDFTAYGIETTVIDQAGASGRQPVDFRISAEGATFCSLPAAE